MTRSLDWLIELLPLRIGGARSRRKSSTDKLAGISAASVTISSYFFAAAHVLLVLGIVRAERAVHGRLVAVSSTELRRVNEQSGSQPPYGSSGRIRNAR